MASIEIIEIGDTYINAKLTGLSTEEEYKGTARTAYWTLSSDGGKTFTTYATSDLEMQDVNGQVIRLEEVEAYLKGLNPNTEYVFTVVVYNRDTNKPSSGKPLSTIEYKNSEGKNLIKTKSAGSSGESGGDSSETSDFLTVEYNANSRRITMTVNFDIKFPIGSCTFYIKKPDGKTTNIDGNSSTNRVTVEYTADSAGTYIIQAVVWTNGEAAGSSYKYDDDWGGYPSDEIKITLENPRPDKFAWKTSNLVAGQTICVTASDWNALMDNINAVREYCGVSRVNFVSVKGVSNGYSESKSTKISADIYNEAVNAIKGIGGTGISEVVANDYLNYKIKASHFTSLSEAINRIEK